MVYTLVECKWNGERYGPFNDVDEARKSALLLSRKKNVSVAVIKDGRSYGRVDKGWSNSTHPYGTYITANGPDTIALYMPYFERMDFSTEYWICNLNKDGSLGKVKFKVAKTGYEPMTKQAKERLAEGNRIYSEHIDNYKRERKREW